MRKGEVEYQFRGSNQLFQTLEDPEVILSGPSETGKTIAVLYRLHQLCLKYPVQAVIVRKVAADLHSFTTLLLTSLLAAVSVAVLLAPTTYTAVYGWRRRATLRRKAEFMAFALEDSPMAFAVYDARPSTRRCSRA